CLFKEVGRQLLYAPRPILDEQPDLTRHAAVHNGLYSHFQVILYPLELYIPLPCMQDGIRRTWIAIQRTTHRTRVDKERFASGRNLNFTNKWLMGMPQHDH